MSYSRKILYFCPQKLDFNPIPSMKRVFIALCVILFAGIQTMAEPVSTEAARQQAMQFLAQHGRAMTSADGLHLARRHAPQAGRTQAGALYYGFNADNGGVVVVSGDDRAPAILGYSNTGTFDASDVPPAMLQLLDYYAESELESITTFEEAFDNRITQQIPAEYLSKVSAYMPIYSGNTPPNIEGSYLLNPLTVVYDETGHYHVGKVISDMFIRFSGQNVTQNTLSYDMKQGNSTGNSDKVVILGKGNQFTAFFIETGTSMGISTKAANIYSGTVTATGLKDITFGYIFIEKGVDPNHDLMDVGKVRIFKDGDRMSDPTSWSARLTSPRTGEGGHAEGSITAR